MTIDQEVVTADTEAETPIDTIEVESVNSEAQPNDGSESSKGDSPAEPKAEPKSLNPRTQQRKAERERLIRENATKDERLRNLEEQIAKTKPLEKPANAAPELDLSKEPDITKYTDPFLYNQHVAKYEAHQVLAERDKKDAEAKQQKLVEAFDEQAEVIKAEMPDFEQKVIELYNSGLVTKEINDAVLSSPNSAELAKHFVQFPGDLKALSQYKPEAIPQAIKQINNWIKGQTSAPANNQGKRQTKASAPITPVGQKASITKNLESLSQEELENMPQHEFEARYMKKR